MKLRSPWVLMPVILALALVLAAGRCARAADFEQRYNALPQGYTCSLVVRIVREVGERMALAAAHSEGWSERQIQAARRCVQR